MNCIALIAVLGAVALNVACLPSPDHESHPWDSYGVDEGSSFGSYGGFDDSARELAPESHPTYDVPTNVHDSYNRYTGNFGLKPYGGEAQHWPSPEDRLYEEREMYKPSFNYLHQLAYGPHADHREFGGRQGYEYAPNHYEPQRNYHNGPNMYGNAYNLGPLQPERRFQHSDIYMNEPYARVEIQPSPVYTGI